MNSHFLSDSKAPHARPGRRGLGYAVAALLAALAAATGLHAAPTPPPKETCLDCHAAMTGFAPGHDPSAIGCASCHGGNTTAKDAATAHSGMLLTPGNLDVARKTCATSGCHSGFDDRLHASPMDAMSGIIAVDKFAFGESRDLDALRRVQDLGHSPADTHLRGLCASCHLGAAKPEPAPVGESSRGGGCSACHLAYEDSSLREFMSRDQWRAKPGAPAPLHHPRISAHVGSASCFGCHSRSGRISTNFEGWHETQLPEAVVRANQAVNAGRFRILEDGRVFERRPADVHFERGMGCTDCHVAAEIMGDGQAHAHAGEAIKTACEDCHSRTQAKADPLDSLDTESQTLVRLRKAFAADSKFVRTASGSSWYPNVIADSQGRPELLTEAAGHLLHPKPRPAACGGPGDSHRRLDCRACHAAWTPQCISCHTSFDPKASSWDHLDERFVKGEWTETGNHYLAEPPVLGIVEGARTQAAHAQVTTFAPGMIMTLDKGRGESSFVRLYAPVSPHTTSSKARDCRDCHDNPLALGYGRGRLAYDVSGGTGRWTFEPEFPRSPVDGLPMDAWTEFLQEPAAPRATRSNARPFSLDEQRRVLLVGACLKCHEPAEPALSRTFADFDHYQDHLSRRCILPAWAGAPALPQDGPAGRPGVP